MKHLTILLFLATAILAPWAKATIPVTTAFSRTIDYAAGGNDFANGMAADSAGNLYLVGETQGSSYTLWNLSKFDKFGNPLWSQNITTLLNGSGPSFVDADSLGNVWIGGSTDLGFTVAKYNSAGICSWVQLVGTTAGQTSVLAHRHDASGNLIVAYSDLLQNSFALFVSHFGPKGQFSNDYTNTGLTPNRCLLNADGFLLAEGTDTITQNPEALLLNPSYQEVHHESITKTPGITYSYRIAVDSTNHFLIGTTIHTGSGDGYQLQAIDEAWTVLWISNIFPDSLQQIAAADPNNVYTLTQNGSASNLNRVTATAVTWSVPSDLLPMEVDGLNGVAIARRLPGSILYQIQEFSPLGTLSWQATVGDTTTFSNTYFSFLKSLGGALYSVGSGRRAVTGYDVIFQKYVLNSFPLPPTPSTINLQGGANLAGTVKLNATAKVNTAVTLVSSNPYVISVPGIVVVPNGLAAAGFIAQTGVVDAPTPIILSERFNGVQRNLTVNVLPAPFKSLIFSQNPAKAGSSVKATLTLNGVTGFTGRTITLKSGNAGIAQVPGTVYIAPGGNSVTFTVSTVSSANATVTITAASPGVTISSQLTVAP